MQKPKMNTQDESLIIEQAENESLVESQIQREYYQDIFIDGSAL